MHHSVKGLSRLYISHACRPRACVLTICRHYYNFFYVIGSTDSPTPRTVTADPLSEPGKIRVSWTPPTPPTGSTITGYSIQYRIGSSEAYTNASDPGSGSTNTTITALQLGRTYQVRVGAKTEIGVGPSNYKATQVTTYNCEFASPIYLAVVSVIVTACNFARI